MSACTAGRIGPVANVGNRNSWWREMYDDCTATATHQISSGCVHEHVLTWDICGACAAAMAARIEAGAARNCVACYRLHAGKCPVATAIRELEAVS